MNLPKDSQDVYLPVEIGQMQVFRRMPTLVYSHVTRVIRTGKRFVADARIVDEAGQTVIEIRDFVAQRVEQQSDVAGVDRLEDLCFHYRWQRQPRPNQRQTQRSSAFLPTPTALSEQTRIDAELLDRHLQLSERNLRFEQAANPLCRDYVLLALDQLGVSLQPGDRITAPELMERARIAEGYNHLIVRYLEMLAEDGVVVPEDGAYRVIGMPEFARVEEAWKDILSARPDNFSELTLIGRCGQRLAEVLRGEINPLHLIFPGNSFAATDHLYQDSPFLRYFNMLAQRAIAHCLAEVPAGQQIRILEIGAGTGGLTSYVVPKLSPELSDYVYTDMSNTFFIKAQEKFRQYPFVRYQLLNIELDPVEQGFQPHSFDLILASEALHATADLGQTMTHIKRLLASEGLVVLLEGTRDLRWVHFVFGLTDGWWRFSDHSLRPTSPLLPFEGWNRLLHSLEFTDVREASGHTQLDHAVILARGPRVDIVEENDGTPETVAAEGAATDTMSLEAASSDAAPGQLADVDAAEPVGHWVLIADRGGRWRRLAQLLRARGATCQIVSATCDAAGTDDPDSVAWMELDCRDPQQAQKLVDQNMTTEGQRCRGIVHLLNLDIGAATWGDRIGREASDGAGARELSCDDLESAAQAGSLSVLYLAQSLTRSEGVELPRLWLVTQCAQSIDREIQAVNSLQSGVWGLNRVLVNELPGLRSTAIDLGEQLNDEVWESFIDELLLDGPEDEIALRGSNRFIHRFCRPSDAIDATETTVSKPGTLPFQLQVSASNTLEKMRLSQVSKPALEPDMVEIQVIAAGLNFSDVMKALGIYPGLGDGPVPLGIECAGIVTRVGEGVSQIKVGDEVVAVAVFSFAAFAYTSSDLCGAKASAHQL